MTRLLFVALFVLVASSGHGQTLTLYAELPGYTHLVTGRVGPPRPVIDVVLYRASDGAFVMVLPTHPQYPVQRRDESGWGDCVDRAGFWPIGLDEIAYIGNMGPPNNPVKLRHRWALFDRDTGRLWHYDIETDGACIVASSSPVEPH